MTEAETKKLEAIAHAVFHEVTNANEGKIIGDIALVTGRDWRRAISGLRMMREQNLVPPGAINETTVGIWASVADSGNGDESGNNMPNASRLHLIAELMDRLECIPRAAEFCPVCRPKVITLIEMQEKYFSRDLEF